MKSELTKHRRLDRLLATRDSTVGHWRFRGDLTDESGNGNDLTALAIGSYVGEGWTEFVTTCIKPTAPAGPAANILAASATDFDFGTGNFTVELVLATTSGGAQYLVVKEDGGGTTTGFILITNGGHLGFKIGDGANDVIGGTTDTINYGRWHHIAFVVDRTNNNVHVYIDGVEGAGSPDSISAVTGSVTDVTANLEVGKLFDGTIDELVMHTEALTAGMVAERAAGFLVPEVPVVSGELIGNMPAMHHGNDFLDELLIPFEQAFTALRDKSGDVADLIQVDQIPERHLPALASMFNFELPDPAVADLSTRREMLKWVTWLYQRKGTYACVQKLFDLMAFTGTMANNYPVGVPFVLNRDRLFGYGLVRQTLFTEDFATNLAQWDPPLNSSLPWRQQNGALYCKVDWQQLANYGILCDDSERSFYMEADVKMISAIDANFGFYLAYQDSDNWLRLTKETAGGVFWLLRWAYGGGTSFTILGSNFSTFWDGYNDGDIVKIWIHADLDAKTYTVGIDDTTIVHRATYAHPDITGNKKGLWQGFYAEVEWDDVLMQSLRPELAAILPIENYRDRAMQILYPGTSTTSQQKKAYLAAILPRYIPFGIVPEWIREVPVASRIGFRTGSITTLSGWLLNADRAARIGFRTAGITAIRGDILRTPTATRFGLRTRIDGITKDPGTTRVGFRTGSISKTTAVTLIDAGFDHTDTTPTENYATIFTTDADVLINGVRDDTGFVDSNPSGANAGAVECTAACSAKIIYVYDFCFTSGQTSGLYSGSNNKLEVYYSTGGNWVLLEQFASITRTNNKIEITITTPTSAKYFKVRAYDGSLRSPNGTFIGWSEIEIMEIKEVT